MTLDIVLGPLHESPISPEEIKCRALALLISMDEGAELFAEEQRKVLLERLRLAEDARRRGPLFRR